MRSFILLAAALPLAQGVRIIQSNDDGWSEANIRTFFDVLNTAGQQVVLSGPAENQSGTGLYFVDLKMFWADISRLFGRNADYC